MQAILAVTIPFFALILLGYWAARQGALPEAAIPGLNAYVLFFALPCMLFQFGSSMPFSRLIDPALIGVYTVCALLLVAITIAATWSRRAEGGGVDLKNAAFGALVAAFPNSGFMGVPLLATLFGERAAGPVIGTLLVDLILTSTLCIAVAQAQRRPAGAPVASGAFGASAASAAGGTVSTGGAVGAAAPVGRGAVADVPAWRDAARALRGALGNPLPWAIALGALAAAARLSLPQPLQRIIAMLGDSATPVALFTIGSVLWRAGRHAHTRTPPRHYLPVALIKLFAHPLLVLVVGLAAIALGIGVPAFGLGVLVLAAALPSASNVSLLAERYGADNGRVARIIMASTVLAFASFTVIAWLVRMRLS